MGNKVTVTGANIVYFVVLAASLIYSLILSAIDTVFPDFSDRHFYLVTAIIQYGVILLPVLIYVFTKRVDLKQVFRFRAPGILPSLLIVAISIPALLVANMLNTLVIFPLQFIGNVPPNPIPVPYNMAELLLSIFIIAITPAICEELLHRGLLLTAYDRRGSYRSVAITAVLFGIFHFDMTNLLGPIFLGLLIGYYVVRTNSIAAGMIAHFTNNFIAIITQYLFRNDNSAYQYITVSPEELGSTVIFGAGGLLAVILILKLFRNVTEKAKVITPPISSVRGDICSIFSHWPVITASVIYLLLTGLFLFSIIMSRFT